VHGVLSPATGRLRYVNAGHPPSVIVAADGAWRAGLDATAPALGLFEGSTFPAADVTLAPGDTLVVVSDGVSEALDPEGREFELAMVAALAADPHRDPRGIAAAVVDAVCRHRGADQGQDDVTVLSLWRRP
jgi:sigma-B regulation protein RsbU (phosphoserine phosphatase)